MCIRDRSAINNAARNRTATITVRTVGGNVGSNSIAAANGMIFNGSVQTFADGGMRRENHVAQMAPAGAWRVWAEPETGGESYIPHAPSKRPRSMQILEATAAMFGRSLVPMMDGAVLTPPSQSASFGGNSTTTSVTIADGAVTITGNSDGQVQTIVQRELDTFTRNVRMEIESL